MNRELPINNTYMRRTLRLGPCLSLAMFLTLQKEEHLSQGEFPLSLSFYVRTHVALRV